MRKRFRRLAVGLAIGAAALTATTLTDDALTATPADTGWGAEDTSQTPADTGWGTPPVDTGTMTIQGDTGWG